MPYGDKIQRMTIRIQAHFKTTGLFHPVQSFILRDFKKTVFVTPKVRFSWTKSMYKFGASLE